MLLSLPKSGVIHHTFLLNSTFAWKTCVFKSFQESFLSFPHKKLRGDLTEKRQDLTEISIILMILTKI